MNKKFLGYLVFWGVSIALIAAKPKPGNSTPKPAPPRVTAEKATIEDKKLDEDEITLLAETVLKRNFDYAIVEKPAKGSSFYNAMVTSEGFTGMALEYDPNNRETKEAYNMMVESLQTLCETLNNGLEENDLDGEFIVSILNDVNTENVLLTVTEDRIIYSMFK